MVRGVVVALGMLVACGSEAPEGPQPDAGFVCPASGVAGTVGLTAPRTSVGDALVVLSGPDLDPPLSARTEGGTGWYAIGGAPAGTYELTASYPSLRTQQQSVDIVAGECVVVDFALEELPIDAGA
jgi:hypothetical protein